MKYKLEEIINTVLNDTRLTGFSTFATAKLGKNIAVLTGKDVSCYTAGGSYWASPRIVLGKLFYPTIKTDTSKTVSVKDVRSVFKDVASIYIGVFYHEFFHARYTPFKVLEDLLKGGQNSVVAFYARVSNILEDVTIEGAGVKEFPSSLPFIEHLFDAAFGTIPEKLPDLVANSPLSADAFLSYLLSYAREIPGLPDYELFTKHEEFIKWGVHLCVNTIEPELRAHRQIKFAKEILKILDGKDPEKEDLGDDNTPADVTSYTPSSPVDLSSPTVDNVMSKVGDITEDKASPGTDPQKINVRETKAEFSPDDLDVSDINTIDMMAENIHQLANNDPNISVSHRFNKLSDFKNTSAFLSSYESIVSDHVDQINDNVRIIRKMISQNRKRWNRYQMSGKLDLKSLYKPDNYKFFKRQDLPKQEADLVFSILVDNSGSMCGSKSSLAGRAAIIFSEALHRLKIPFSVDAFTQGNEAITIGLKGFIEDYSVVKTNLTLFTEQFNVNELKTFCGNVDEANLKFVRDRLQMRKEKDKVIIVISDGATCGSEDTLNKLASNIESQGISVLGIGIYDTNVERIYSNHKVISTQEELEGLGQFLNDYLVKKTFKGGI